MQVLSAHELSPQEYEQIAQVLAQDGIVCFPSGGAYRLATRILSEDAVIKFLQIKRRTQKAPVLIFLPHPKELHRLAEEIPPEARILMDTFWPGPLTLQLPIHPHLPQKIVRNLNQAKRVGFRIPEDPIAFQILQHFQEPLLISSANLATKKGSHSEASVRKNFGRWIDILISAGDLAPQGNSTVVDATTHPPQVTRQGKITEQQILQAYQDHVTPPSLQPSAVSILSST